MKLTTRQKKAYAYCLGQYLGDGHISQGKRSFRLRIFSDSKYQAIIKEIKENLSYLLPKNKVGEYLVSNSRCTVIYVYSQSLVNLFPQHGVGKKSTRSIILLPWQEEIILLYPKEFLRGLYHSDGCRFIDKGYIHYNFSNTSKDIIMLIEKILNELKIEFKTRQKPVKPSWNPCQVVWVTKKSESSKLDKFLNYKQ